VNIEYLISLFKGSGVKIDTKEVQICTFTIRKNVDFEEFLRVILVIVGSLPEHGAKKLENPKYFFT